MNFKRLSRKMFVYMIALVVMVAAIKFKKTYFLDELLSYQLANNETGSFTFTDGELYNPRDLYIEQLAVQDERRFDYQTVWNNQANDVHPPLSYMLLHTVCSLMPDTVSKWLPASVNLVFGLLSLFIVRRILRLLLMVDDKNESIIDIISLAYAVTPGILNNILLFRMYVMAMFWVVLAEYLLLGLVTCVWNKETISWKCWLSLLFTHLGAALTHYYCVMFLVFAEGAFLVVLLLHKCWKEIGVWLLTTLVSAGVAIAIFPAMLTHIFGGYRGEESASNLMSMTFTAFIKRFDELYHAVDAELFGGVLTIVLVTTVFVAMVRLHSETKEQIGIASVFEQERRLLFVWTPCVCFFVLLSIIAVGLTTRYVFPLYALLFAAVAALIWWVVSKATTHRNEVMACTMAVLLVLSYSGQPIENLHLEETLPETIQTDYHYKNALVIYDQDWKCVDLYDVLQDCARVCYITADEYSMLIANGLSNESEMLVFATNPDDVQGLMQYLDRSMSCTEIGVHTYFKAFYLTSES